VTYIAAEGGHFQQLFKWQSKPGLLRAMSSYAISSAMDLTIDKSSTTTSQ
jgi:hypothetical protein